MPCPGLSSVHVTPRSAWFRGMLHEDVRDEVNGEDEGEVWWVHDVDLSFGLGDAEACGRV